MSTSFAIRAFLFCGLAAASLAGAAEAGFGHLRHRQACEPECAAIEPGCSAFVPACEPGCAAFDAGGWEPGCGCETVCPSNPCIKYRHKHACRHKHAHGCGCCPEPTYETVLEATSPETCCTVAVPVCLPICCEGCPCESSRCTLLGCGLVRFDYCCGVSVVVRFQKCGDILVTYHGF
ncbi:MAG: hypothetical protein ACKOSQ_08280 [Planctomycetaceae bacterium]